MFGTAPFGKVPFGVSSSTLSSLTKAITSTADDCSYYSGALDTGNVFQGTNGTPIYGGFRFPSLAIPQGARIVGASLRLVCWSAGGGSGGSAWGNWYGDAVDNAAAWSSGSRPDQITKTTASTPVQFSLPDQTVVTHDVTAIVQEIISRSGWASGNALRIGGDPTGAVGGFAAYYDYTTNSSFAAQLSVTWYVPATFTATGALVGQLGSIAATADHTTPAATHATSGTLTGQIGSVAGSAAHNAPHPTSGALTGQIGSVAGTAAHSTLHSTSGSLTGQLGSVSGTAAHVHAATGALTGQIGSVSGSAVHYTLHTSSGALTGQIGSIAGTAAHHHAVTGSLTGQIGSVSGAAVHSGAAVTHTSTGALTGQIGSIAGTASRTHLHDATGALAGQLGSIAGVAAHLNVHMATGDLIGPGAVLEAHSRLGAVPAWSARHAGRYFMRKLLR